jgi:hypothetical protein
VKAKIKDKEDEKYALDSPLIYLKRESEAVSIQIHLFDIVSTEAAGNLSRNQFAGCRFHITNLARANVLDLNLNFNIIPRRHMM